MSAEIVMMSDLALTKLSGQIQAIVNAEGVEIQHLSDASKIEIGVLLWDASNLAYFDTIDLPVALSKGYEPARLALISCVSMLDELCNS